MKFFLYIMLMMVASISFAWDEMPPIGCQHAELGDCFQSGNDVMRSIASGSNYHAHVMGTTDLVLENPTLEETSLHVILVREDGNHEFRFLRLKARQSRVVEAEEFEGANEVYVINNQNRLLKVPHSGAPTDMTGPEIRSGWRSDGN